jgi:hypothetical protein
MAVEMDLCVTYVAFLKNPFPRGLLRALRGDCSVCPRNARSFSAELGLIHAYGAEALAYGPLPITDPQLPEEARLWRRNGFDGNEFHGVAASPAV